MAKDKQSNWTVYILKCADDTLYTGITNDLATRIIKHETGKGAKYTRGRSPYHLVYTEEHATKSMALRRELEIKALRRFQKILLTN